MKFDKLTELINRAEVLSDIYKDLSKKGYPTKAEIGVAKLKMQLIKKEILMINYMIDKELEP